MKRQSNPARLPLESWCSLSAPQCYYTEKTEPLDACDCGSNTLQLTIQLYEKMECTSSKTYSHSLFVANKGRGVFPI